jgi:hypothetical protein
MYFVVEALFVGLYTVILYLALQQVAPIRSEFLFLFLVGFSKHLLGNVLQIHRYYCKHGEACAKIKPSSKSCGPFEPTTQLIAESLVEGALFGSFSYTGLLDGPIRMFEVGFLLHILAEWIGYHNYFCTHRCSDK